MKPLTVKAISLALVALFTVEHSTLASSKKAEFGCDLSLSEGRTLVNKKPYARVEGGYDYQGRTWWWDVALLPLVLPVLVRVIDCNRGRLDCNADKNDALWYKKAKRTALTKCKDYIRYNFAEDVWKDEAGLSGEFLARHYECGEPYELQNEEGGGTTVVVDVLKGDPIYDKLSTEQIIQTKCLKLQACLGDTKNAEQVRVISEQQMELGCQ